MNNAGMNWIFIQISIIQQNSRILVNKSLKLLSKERDPVNVILFVDVQVSSSVVAPPYRGEEVWVRQWPWEVYQR